MIVVEGFDGAGKSTLAEAIGAKLGWPVLHTGGPTKDAADVILCLDRSKQRLRQRCVQDRITHISESVYSMLTHPAKAARALDRLREVEMAWVVVYCRPPDAALIEALARHTAKEWDTKEHLATIASSVEQLIRIYDAVMEVAAIHTARMIRYDRTVPGILERTVNEVEGYIK